MYRHCIKRILDIILSLFGIVILAIPMLIIAIIIKIDSPGPAIFRQARVGKNNVEFNLLKFRTMKVDTPNNIPTCKFENPEKYITRVGAFLRKSSMDEIPQIYNILLGQMSFVGPRPLVLNEGDIHKLRIDNGVYEVRPGLSGWAQINGRDDMDNNTKVKFDTEYVKKYNFIFDLKCIVGTIKCILTREGIVEGGTDNTESREC